MHPNGYMPLPLGVVIPLGLAHTERQAANFKVPLDAWGDAWVDASIDFVLAAAAAAAAWRSVWVDP